MKRNGRKRPSRNWFGRFIVKGLVLAALVIAWVFNSVAFDFLSATQDSDGDYVLRSIDPRIDSEVIAVEALKGGVIWIDSLVMYEGLGFAFSPYGCVAIMTPGEFPRWHLLSAAWHTGDRSKFDFEANARKARKNLLIGP